MQEVVARRYSQAIGLVQEALKDEVEAGKDSTLMSILLLSMFEVSNGSLPHTGRHHRDHRADEPLSDYLQCATRSLSLA
jgi:hypothetical protein